MQFAFNLIEIILVEVVVFVLHHYSQEKVIAWVNERFSLPFNVNGGCELRFPVIKRKVVLHAKLHVRHVCSWSKCYIIFCWSLKWVL